MRILVVEDERALAAAVRRGLEAEGFAVEVSHDGRDGLWQATEFDFDVIVLDIMLPGLNGYDVCRQLRAAGVTTPVLMLTAKDGEFDEADAFDLGADDYLTKPFELAELVARLRALLRRTTRATPSVDHPITVGPLTVDLRGHRAHIDGRRIELTKREFDLLSVLAEHAGVVLSRAQLLRLVWGYDFAADTNVVDVFVTYLRKKLEVDGAPRVIHTVRGVGFVLRAER